MFSKIFAPLLGNRLVPAQRFPQIKLRPQEHRRVTHHRQCSLPLSLFDPSSVKFAQTELDAGRVVEIRRESNRLVALGFFEPEHNRVDVFHLTPSNVTCLPTISEDTFVARVHESWERRRRMLNQTLSNTYRIVNGYADGLPSLYIDIFSESFARVIATSAGAERVVPAVVSFLQRRGAEEVLLDTPTLGSKARVTFVNPTTPMNAIYVERGIFHKWMDTNSNVSTLTNRYLLNPAHRRARDMIRNLGCGQRVLCVNDRSGAAALNAVMTAKHVTVVEENIDSLNWVSENLLANHGSSIFATCETIHSTLADLSLRVQQDVVYMEHHPLRLATVEQWTRALSCLIEKRIIGVGTIIIIAQESAPLGVTDLLQRFTELVKKVHGEEAALKRPATRFEMSHAIRSTLAARKLRIRFLRAFSVSFDFPLLPKEQAECFSQAYLVEGPSID